MGGPSIAMMRTFDDRPGDAEAVGFGDTQPRTTDVARCVAYALVALSAFLAGIVVGQANDATPPGSRIDWPQLSQPKPHPRTLGD